VAYRVDNEVHFGQINRIFTLDHGDVLFQMFSLVFSADFTYETSEAKFCYDHIQVGTINSGTAIYFIKAEQIIENCVFHQRANNSVAFVRFPNWKNLPDHTSRSSYET
jgi:hypothetical protein